MFLNKALSLPSSELHLVQTILEEAAAMHTDPAAIRDQALDVLQLNLQQCGEIVFERFSAIVDELLAHMDMPAGKLLVAIGVLSESGFDEQADRLRSAIEDRSQLIRLVPALESDLRELSDQSPSGTAGELTARHAAWRALEHLTFNSRLGSRSAP